ncbi:MAG: hypothetical protein J0L57_13600 [Burkholderiales bacterium]|nr:hypothetical protein [Burkholderiales bacterium]
MGGADVRAASAAGRTGGQRTRRARITRSAGDVEEWRDVGVYIWSRMNVKRLESLNDIVGGITGTHVWETVPDRLIAEADKLVVIDASVALCRYRGSRVRRYRGAGRFDGMKCATQCVLDEFERLHLACEEQCRGLEPHGHEDTAHVGTLGLLVATQAFHEARHVVSRRAPREQFDSDERTGGVLPVHHSSALHWLAQRVVFNEGQVATLLVDVTAQLDCEFVERQGDAHRDLCLFVRCNPLGAGGWRTGWRRMLVRSELPIQGHGRSQRSKAVVDIAVDPDPRVSSQTFALRRVGQLAQNLREAVALVVSVQVAVCVFDALQGRDSGADRSGVRSPVAHPRFKPFSVHLAAGRTPAKKRPPTINKIKVCAYPQPLTMIVTENR